MPVTVRPSDDQCVTVLTVLLILILIVLLLVYVVDVTTVTHVLVLLVLASLVLILALLAPVLLLAVLVVLLILSAISVVLTSLALSSPPIHILVLISVPHLSPILTPPLFLILEGALSSLPVLEADQISSARVVASLLILAPLILTVAGPLGLASVLPATSALLSPGVFGWSPTLLVILSALVLVV